MYFLGKAFEFRGKAHGTEEKPFLDHLEDLRTTLTKIVITLLVSTIICWIFKDKILDVISRPVEQVWVSQQAEKLPKEFTVEEWEEIKKAESGASRLSIEQKKQYYAHYSNPKMEYYASAYSYYYAAMQLPDDERRMEWIAKLELPEEQYSLVTRILEKKPSLQLHAKNSMVEMKSFKPTETFMLSFKLAFFAGLVISLPLLLWYILEFILPGLHSKEKKVMWPAMLVGFGLFLSGCTFAYFVVLPQAIGFFFKFGESLGVQDQWRIGYYAGFVTQFTLVFGLAFELPVIVIALVKVGLINYTIMAKTRSYAVVAIVVIAAAITPGSELLSLCLLAVPMYLLYEASILYAYFDEKKQRKQEVAEMVATGTRKVPVVESSSLLLEADSDNADDLSEEVRYVEDKIPEKLEDDEEVDTELEGVNTEGDEADSDSYDENVLEQKKFKEKSEEE